MESVRAVILLGKGEEIAGLPYWLGSELRLTPTIKYMRFDFRMAFDFVGRAIVIGHNKGRTFSGKNPSPENLTNCASGGRSQCQAGPRRSGLSIGVELC
jgi:hypothetical protein